MSSYSAHPSSMPDIEARASQLHAQVSEQAQPGTSAVTTIETRVEPGQSGQMTNPSALTGSDQGAFDVAARKVSGMKEQMSARASELGDNVTAPKEKPNEAEQHVDNLTRGMVGMVATAPLAAAEYIAPTVTHGLGQATTKAQEMASSFLGSAQQTASSTSSATSQKASELGQSVRQAASNSDLSQGGIGSGREGSGTVTGTSVGDKASDLVEQVTSLAQSYLPTALGGRPASQEVNSKSMTQSASETAGAATDKATETVSHTAQAAKQSVDKTFDSASSTAQQYMPSTTSLYGLPPQQPQERTSSFTQSGDFEGDVSKKLPSYGGLAAHPNESGATADPSPYARQEDNQPHSQLYSSTTQGQHLASQSQTHGFPLRPVIPKPSPI